MYVHLLVCKKAKFGVLRAHEGERSRSSYKLYNSLPLPASLLVPLLVPLLASLLASPLTCVSAYIPV